MRALEKPLLADSSLSLDFNLSHSGDWLACAVTAGTPPRLRQFEVSDLQAEKEVSPTIRAVSEPH